MAVLKTLSVKTEPFLSVTRKEAGPSSSKSLLSAPSHRSASHVPYCPGFSNLRSPLAKRRQASPFGAGDISQSLQVQSRVGRISTSVATAIPRSSPASASSLTVTGISTVIVGFGPSGRPSAGVNSNIIALCSSSTFTDAGVRV